MYNPHFESFFKCTHRYAVLYGGAGSSKSYSAAQKIVERCTHSDEKHLFLVIRKFKTTIEGSVFNLIRHIISEFGIDKHVTINRTKHEFHFSNGNSIVTTGLDDVEKLKSIHGITSIWVEESSEIEESDLGQLNLRLRGETDSYKQIIFTFNPISENHWLKKRFFDDASENVFTLWSNYRHNMFLDDEYIRLLETEYEYDPNMHRIYVLGEWGKERTKCEFYAMFDKDKNVKHVSYNPELNIHISFDWNINPYLSMSLWHILENDGVYTAGCFEEVPMENPKNNTEDACKEFMERYPNSDLGVFIYGDASGRAKSTTSKVHNYDIVETQLKRYLRNSSMRVPKRNPLFNKRRDFINKCLAEGYEDIRVLIDPSCELMIADMENVLEDAGGGKAKQTKKNKAGVIYEPFGHFSDTMDYLLCSAFETKFRDFGRKLI